VLLQACGVLLFLNILCVVCFGGVLCICTDVYMYELIRTWLEVCWCYVADWLLVLWYPSAG